MSHRERDCTCPACIALGRVASVVVDEETSEEHRAYIAKVLERSYTKILEKGLELLRKERQATDEGSSGVACHAIPGSEQQGEEGKAPGGGEPSGVGEVSTPGTGSAEPPADLREKVKEEKTEVEEETPKKKRRGKRRVKEEEEKAQNS